MYSRTIAVCSDKNYCSRCGNWISEVQISEVSACIELVCIEILIAPHGTVLPYRLKALVYCVYK